MKIIKVLITLCFMVFQGALCSSDSNKDLNAAIQFQLISARKLIGNAKLLLELDVILPALIRSVNTGKTNKFKAIDKIKAIKTALKKYKSEQYPKYWPQWLCSTPEIVKNQINPALIKVSNVLKLLNPPSTNENDIARATLALGLGALTTGVIVAASSSSNNGTSVSSQRVINLDHSISKSPRDRTISELSFGGRTLNIHDYELPYPVVASSAPQEINYRNNLIELPVLQQNRGVWQGNDVNMGMVDNSNKTYTMADLQGADGLNCGYHALKNVIYMLAACKKLELGSTDDAQNLLYKMQDIPSFTQLLTPWLQFVILNRYQNDLGSYRRYPLGNFPSGTELEKILGENRSRPRIPQGLESVFNDGLHSHILILDSFSYLTNPTDKYLTILENIVNHKNGLYGFVVNDAANKSLAIARGSHWFGYVLWKKNGRSIWFYTDSLFSRHDEVTRELMRICSQTSVEFNEFQANRDFSIINDPLLRIEERLDRFLENSNTGQDTLGAIFDQLLREPVGTKLWSRDIVNRVMQIVTLTLDYMVARKEAFAIDYQEFKGYCNRIFAKIRGNAGIAKDEDISLCMQKLEELRRP